MTRSSGLKSVHSQSSSRKAKEAKSMAEQKDWERQLPSEMKKIYQHFRSFDETPRLRRGGKFQDLMLPKTKRQPIEGEDETVEEGSAFEPSKKTNKTKGVAFDLGEDKGQANGKSAMAHQRDNSTEAPYTVNRRIHSSPAHCGTSTSSPSKSDGDKNLEKTYRRDIARFYAGDAASYKDFDKATFPTIPRIPDGAKSKYLSEIRNDQVWQWLNRDFCKNKLEFFLSLCS